MNGNPLVRSFLPFTRFLALIGGYALLLLSLLITVEILLRRFANVSLQGSDEMGGYVLAIVAAFGFSFTLLERAHTRVEILVERINPRTAAILNFISCAGTMLMALFIAWRGWATLMESIEYKSLSGTPLMTPLWLPQSVWVAGLLVFAVIATLVAFHALALLVRDWTRVNQFYGLKTLDEIIRDEQVADPPLAAEITT